MTRPGVRITFWRGLFALVAAAGIYAAWLRFAYGLGAATNLSDQFPWGLWIGFDVLCGVGLAGGGFTLVAIVHIFNIERYRPILRPTILTAFLGYLLVILALMFDLGQPQRIWHPLVMWNPHSVMFEVGWCVTLYTTVLALEFAPAVVERFRLTRVAVVLRAISVPLVIAGVLLSTLHQSSLGSLYLLVPEKLHPLWWTPLLPVFFFVTSISVGLAMVIFESWHSSRAFHRQLEVPLLQSLARILAVVLAVVLVARFLDLRYRGALPLAFQPTWEAYMFWLEAGLSALAALLLFSGRVRRSPNLLYGAAVLAIGGFMANRLNIAVTGMEASSGATYFPRWTEVAVTLFIVGIGFAVFRMVAGVLPVFEAVHKPHEEGLRVIKAA